ncbi:MAG: TonB-dependent receptor [Breznakibacter sp.]
MITNILARLFFFAMLLCPGMLLSQKTITDTTIMIDDVEVRASRLKTGYSGGTVLSVDSSVIRTYQTSSLSQLLGDATGVSVRSYGPAGMASVSMRGGGAAHTAVIWNGLNLQSPMNGGVNLSVIPVGLINHVDVQYGGSGTLYGAGNMSGAIHLSNPNMGKQPNHFIFGVTLGSFGSLGINASAKAGNQKQYLLVNGLFKLADNDFRFVNTAKYGQPNQTQTNAQMQQHGASLDYGYRFSDAFRLGFASMYSHNAIHIPTQMTQASVNRETQTDNNLLSSLNIRYTGNSQTVTYKFGTLYNQVLYHNPNLQQSETDNHSQSVVHEIEYKQTIARNHIATIVVNYTHETAHSDAFAADPSRDRFSGVAFYRINGFNDRLEWTTSIRQESSNSHFFPIVYGSGFDFGMANWLTFKTCASKTYRVPTFNDLYWKEALAYGNPNLKPENGWSAEGSLEQRFNLNSADFLFSESLFANSFRDWIVWLPDASGAWTPTNKEKGLSRGIEFRATAKKTIGRARLKADAGYTFTHSEIESSDEYNKRSMTYVPKHKASSSWGIECKGWTGLLQLNYNGERYYDNSNSLEGYFTGNLHLSKQILVWGHQTYLSGHVYNLSSTNYQVMAWYAMPRRNYSISLNITL